MPAARHMLSKSLLATAVLLTPAATLATAPPQPAPTESYAQAWVGFMFMGVLLALVLGVSLMPSKRGHQD